MQKFTPRALQVLSLAKKEAQKLKHNYLGTEHLLLGIIMLNQGVAVNVLRKMGVSLESVKNAIENSVGVSEQTEESGDVPHTPKVKRVLAFASNEATQLGHNYIGTEHLLLGLLREGEGVAAQILLQLNVNIENCRKMILSELDPNFVGDSPEAEQSSTDFFPQPSEKSERQSALKAFGRDLTELARKGKLDPVIGRSKEIMRVVQILCRRTKK